MVCNMDWYTFLLDLRFALGFCILELCACNPILYHSSIETLPYTGGGALEKPSH
jgi:hypothetical protein